MHIFYVGGKIFAMIMLKMLGATVRKLFARDLYTHDVEQCFSTAGLRPGTGPWHQLYLAARGFSGICYFIFLSIFHE